MKLGPILLLVFFNVAILSTNAWDIAVAVGDQIQFLQSKGEVEGSVTEGLAEVRALAYNSDLHRMYFGDNKRDDGSIFQITVPEHMSPSAGYNLSVNVSAVVLKQVHDVKGIAYDDQTGILYWTNGQGRAILWQRMDTSTDRAQAGQPLPIKSDQIQIPMGIAIDNCKRYLYWTNCGLVPSIERSLLDGSERQTLISSDLALPYAVVVDQVTDRLYWVDERPGSQFRIESSEMDGKDRTVLFDGSEHQPFALAISSGSVFWADHIHRSVWRLPLDKLTSTHRPEVVASYRVSPQALVSSQSGRWDRIKCNPVKEPKMVIIPATVTKSSVEVPIGQRVNSSHPLCLHSGIWITDRGYCDCLPGFSGEFCEVDECLGYCVNGECLAGRSCQCHEGFTGVRCEVSVCHNYCLNGNCSIDLTGQPQCHCKDGYSGQRCEINFTKEKELQDSLREVCSTFCKLWASSSKENIQPFDACSCPEFDDEPLEVESKSTSWQDHALIALLTLCSVLIVIVIFLTKKVFVLRKRPRIKKRIIVNKTTTPLTCRPNPTGEEQCEITIENCCNMNICETPCFEPDFRQPQATLSKNGNKGVKEEKKTLLGNIELPSDDLY